MCGATNLGEALRRISEGAAMIRTKGEAGTGNIVEVRIQQTFTYNSIDERILPLTLLPTYTPTGVL